MGEQVSVKSLGGEGDLKAEAETGARARVGHPRGHPARETCESHHLGSLSSNGSSLSERNIQDSPERWAG